MLRALDRVITVARGVSSVSSATVATALSLDQLGRSYIITGRPALEPLLHASGFWLALCYLAVLVIAFILVKVLELAIASRLATELLSDPVASAQLSSGTLASFNLAVESITNSKKLQNTIPIDRFAKYYRRLGRRHDS